MPMVRRGDDDRIHVWISQELAVIHVGLHLRVQTALDTFLPVRSIDIADGSHLDVRSVDDRIEEIPAARAEADTTHPKRLAG